MGLRLSEGVDLERLARLAGIALQPQAFDRIERMLARGLLERGAQGRIRASRSGRLVLNAIVVELARALRVA
jgi:oxygen-independent coproporphyrinogen-3 oxidase